MSDQPYSQPIELADIFLLHTSCCLDQYNGHSTEAQMTNDNTLREFNDHLIKYEETKNNENLRFLLLTMENMAISNQPGKLITAVNMCFPAIVTTGLLTMMLIRCIEMRSDQSAEALASHFPQASFNILRDEKSAHIYEGLAPFHFAIIQNNNDLVIRMLEITSNDTKYDMLHLRAEVSMKDNDTAYVPELPASIAATTGNTTILKYIVQMGGNLTAKDSRHENIIHSLVRASCSTDNSTCLETFDELLHDIVPVWVTLADCSDSSNKSYIPDIISTLRMLMYAKNLDGFTPLSLSVMLGNKTMADKILNIDQVYRFQFCEIASCWTGLYDVREFEPTESSIGLLERIAFNDKPNVGMCLTQPVIKTLVTHKLRYYKPIMIFYGVFGLICTVLVSWAVYFTVFPHLCTSNNRTLSKCDGDPEKRFQYQWADYILVCYAIFYAIEWGILMWALYSKIWRRNQLSWTHLLTISHVLQLETVTLFLISNFCYLCLKAMHSSFDVIFLSLSQLTGWTCVFYLCRLRKSTAFFSVMLEWIFFKDVSRFLFIIIITVAAFTLSLVTIIATEENVNTVFSIPLAAVIDVTLQAVGYNVMTSTFSMEDSTYRWFIKLLSLFFILMINVMLVNLLIAAMNYSYSMINKMANVLCYKVLAKDALTIEATSQIWRKRFIKKYHRVCNLRYMDADGTVCDRQLFLLRVTDTD